MIPSWEGNKGIENDAANKIRDSPRQYYYGNGTTVSLRARLPFQRELNQNIFLYDNLRVKREPKTLIFCDSDDESSRITSTIQLHIRVFLLHSIVSTLPGKMQVSADTGSDHEETGTAFALAEWVPPSKRIERPV